MCTQINFDDDDLILERNNCQTVDSSVETESEKVVPRYYASITQPNSSRNLNHNHHRPYGKETWRT